MNSNAEFAPTSSGSGAVARVFSLADANRSLIFVRRVVSDIVERYGELMRLRKQYDDGSRSAQPLDAMRSRIEVLAAELGELAEELQRVGCEIKDWTLGLVDFPAEVDGRMVCLCWKLGEDSIQWWHEADTGYSGRRPISTLGR